MNRGSSNTLASSQTDYVWVGRTDTSKRILMVYTGGTIGMKENPHTGALAPFDFSAIEAEVPEIARYRFTIDNTTVGPPVDSSDITPEFWVRLARTILDAYSRYDGFVILHGTDTMVYTASALSLMIRGLSKPVVITGSQLPIGAIRTDGKENLLGALEVAATVHPHTGAAMVPEVSIFFNHCLLRGNRSKKIGSERFDAFRSYNYPLLAKAGIHIRYNPLAIRPVPGEPLGLFEEFCTDVITLRLFPGITAGYFRSIFSLPGLRGVILETYGAGNAPGESWLLEATAEAVRRGVLVVNNTQCSADGVSMKSYDAGIGLARAGVVSAGDMTLEASLVKLMIALAMFPDDVHGARDWFAAPQAGELTID